MRCIRKIYLMCEKFEKKIEESGMNEEALREAQKVLNRMKQEARTAMSMVCFMTIWIL